MTDSSDAEQLATRLEELWGGPVTATKWKNKWSFHVKKKVRGCVFSTVWLMTDHDLDLVTKAPVPYLAEHVVVEVQNWIDALSQTMAQVDAGTYPNIPDEAKAYAYTDMDPGEVLRAMLGSLWGGSPKSCVTMRSGLVPSVERVSTDGPRLMKRRAWEFVAHRKVRDTTFQASWTIDHDDAETLVQEPALAWKEVLAVTQTWIEALAAELAEA